MSYHLCFSVCISLYLSFHVCTSVYIFLCLCFYLCISFLYVLTYSFFACVYIRIFLFYALCLCVFFLYICLFIMYYFLIYKNIKFNYYVVNYSSNIKKACRFTFTTNLKIFQIFVRLSTKFQCSKIGCQASNSFQKCRKSFCIGLKSLWWIGQQFSFFVSRLKNLIEQPISQSDDLVDLSTKCNLQANKLIYWPRTLIC